MDDAAERELLRKYANDCEMLPGNQLKAGTDFHVCLTRPIIGSENHEGVCSTCGSKIYFGNVTDLKKLCADCFLKLAKDNPDEIECYGNTESLRRMLIRQALEKCRN